MNGKYKLFFCSQQLCVCEYTVFLQIIPILSWAYSCILPEEAVEVGDVLERKAISNILHRQVARYDF